MRKFISLILMLAVAGVVSSCEKSELNGPNKNNNDVIQGGESNSDDAQMFIGVWTYTAIADELDQINSHSDYIFRFWENGTGYLTVDGYNKEGIIYSLSRKSFTYWVKDERLYVQYAPSNDTIEWEYRFKDNSLILHSDMDEYNNVFTFTKGEDADHRFMGDWSVTKKSGDNYVDEHIKFVTPRDCFTYYFEYTDPNLPPVDQSVRPVWYKYEFDDNTITLTSVESGSTIKKEYKIDGTKLYLNGECYSNFKKENGFE